MRNKRLLRPAGCGGAACSAASIFCVANSDRNLCGCTAVRARSLRCAASLRARGCGARAHGVPVGAVLVSGGSKPPPGTKSCEFARRPVHCTRNRRLPLVRARFWRGYGSRTSSRTHGGQAAPGRGIRHRLLWGGCRASRRPDSQEQTHSEAKQKQNTRVCSDADSLLKHTSQRRVSAPGIAARRAGVVGRSARAVFAAGGRTASCPRRIVCEWARVASDGERALCLLAAAPARPGLAAY